MTGSEKETRAGYGRLRPGPGKEAYDVEVSLSPRGLLLRAVGRTAETWPFAFLSTDGWLMHEQLRIGWLGAYMGIGGRGFEAFVGGHWPSGVCALQDYGFTQSGDGYSFDGPVRTAVGMHVPVPCAILDRVPAARSGVAR